MEILISIGKDADPANYLRAVEEAGGRGRAEYLPAGLGAAYGLILAGGGDVDPALYGEKNCGSSDIDPDRDRAELALLAECARLGRPVLGICRGHQVVNVWAGGGLIQDLGGLNAIHRWEQRDKTHLVCTGEGILRVVYGPRVRVNSAHHQGVGPVGRSLTVTARSVDGVVEAMEHKTLPICTVQFHPERMNGPDTAAGALLFRYFMEKCKNSG